MSKQRDAAQVLAFRLLKDQRIHLLRAHVAPANTGIFTLDRLSPVLAPLASTEVEWVLVEPADAICHDGRHVRAKCWGVEARAIVGQDAADADAQSCILTARYT